MCKTTDMKISCVDGTLFFRIFIQSFDTKPFYAYSKCLWGPTITFAQKLYKLSTKALSTKVLHKVPMTPLVKNIYNINVRFFFDNDQHNFFQEACHAQNNEVEQHPQKCYHHKSGGNNSLVCCIHRWNLVLKRCGVFSGTPVPRGLVYLTDILNQRQQKFFLSCKKSTSSA